MALASIYNHHRYARAILKKFRLAGASMTIELREDHWKFAGQDGTLSYNGPMRPFLQAVRSQTIPSFLIPSILAQDPPIPIYDGCIIVEIRDYRTKTAHVTPQQELERRAQGVDHLSQHKLGARKAMIQAATNSSAHGLGGSNVRPPLEKSGKKKGKQPAEPEEKYLRYRAIMRPDSESLWEQLCYLNVKNGRMIPGNSDWDDEAVLQLEARILAAIAPPLVLETSLLPTRVANLASALTAPTSSYLAHDGDFAGPSTQPMLTTDDEMQAEEEEDEQPPQVDENQKIREMKTEEWLRHNGLRQEDLSALLSGKEKYEHPAKSPFDAMHYITRTLGWYQMRRPGQPIPPDIIITKGSLGPHQIISLPPHPSADDKKRSSSSKKKKKKPSTANAAAEVAETKPETPVKAGKAGSVAATPATVKAELPESAEKDKKKANKSKKKKDAAADDLTAKAPPPPPPVATTASAVSKNSKKKGQTDTDQIVMAPAPEDIPLSAKTTASTSSKSNKKSAKKNPKKEPAEEEKPPPPPPEPPKKKAKKNKEEKKTNIGGAPPLPVGLPAPNGLPPDLANIDLSALAQFIPPGDQGFMGVQPFVGNPGMPPGGMPPGMGMPAADASNGPGGLGGLHATAEEIAAAIQALQAQGELPNLMQPPGQPGPSPAMPNGPLPPGGSRQPSGSRAPPGA